MDQVCGSFIVESANRTLNALPNTVILKGINLTLKYPPLEVHMVIKCAES